MTNLARAPVARDATSGAVLIAAAVAEVALMARHPTAHGHSTAELLAEAARSADVNRAVHGGLIAMALVLAFGFTGFARAAGMQRASVRLGLVAYGVGALAFALAALCNGVAFPAIAERFADADEGTLESVRAVLAWSWAWNQALTGLGLLATSAALGAWSFRLVGEPGAWRWIGGAGLAVAALAPTLFRVGHLRLDVHGFGAFVLAQAAWTVAVGVRLTR